MRNFIKKQLNENLQRILTEETYSVLFDFWTKVRRR